MSTSPKLTPGQAAILEGVIDEPATEAGTSVTRAPLTSISDLSDGEIATLVGLLLQEQQERAVREADPEALTADGFRTLFNSRGDAIEPVLVGGILMCAGSLKNTSATSHICSFVHVDDHWCWDHPDALNDEVRKIPAQGREHQRSITLVPVTEGAKIDFVTCKMTPREGHKAKKSVSYTVTNGELEITDTRSVPSPGTGR